MHIKLASVFLVSLGIKVDGNYSTKHMNKEIYNISVQYG